MHQKLLKKEAFALPAQVEKAVHTLEGLLIGIAIDCEINAQENEVVSEWIKLNKHLLNREPLNELVKAIQYALDFGVLTEEGKEDILWLCQNFKSDNQYYNALNSDLQRLHGMMAGIAADGIIKKDELLNLESWLEEHEELTGSWPYDEITSLIVEVLEDGVIDDDEHKILLAFFNDFQRNTGIPTAESEVQFKELTVGGICVIDPEIQFEGKRFSFTGSSKKASVSEIETIITKLGGQMSEENVSEMTDYLIVGEEGNPFWAFSTYGRKIESAVALRKQGFKITIVREKDFWETVED